MNVNLISLESSANCSSAALLRYRHGQSVVDEQVSTQSQGHAEQLLPMIDQLLLQAGLGRQDVHGVVFGQGPGGFTGLRIAAGMAQGLGLGLDIPVFPVSSLLAVAETVRPALPSTLIVSVLDARMQEAFLAAWQETGDSELASVQAPSLVAAQQIPLWLEQLRNGLATQAGGASGHTADVGAVPVVLVGSGVRQFPEVAAIPQVTLHADAEPSAGVMARIGLRAWLAGRFIPADQAAPLYVRDKVAFTTRERESGQGGNPRAVPLSEGQATPDQILHNPAASSHPLKTRQQAVQILHTAHTVRPMTDEDIDAVVHIECAVQSHPWTAGNFRDSLQAGYEGWVVCHANEIIAFSLQMMAPDVSHLLLIGVRPDWQDKGVGAGLLAWGEERVRACGLDMQVLEVRPSNTRAIAFYQRWGYEQIGVRKGYYPAGRGKSEDALVLQKGVVS